MNNRQTKSKPAKQIPPPPGAEASYDQLIAYHTKYSLDELEKAGHAEEPSQEEVRDLEESAERETKREEAKGLAKAYPKTNNQRTRRLESVLVCFPWLQVKERKAIANALNVIADRAQDLDEITGRILNEKHGPEEIAELLYAFRQGVDYIRSYAENLQPRLIEIFDQTKSFLTKHHIDGPAGSSSPKQRKNSGLKKRGTR